MVYTLHVLFGDMLADMYDAESQVSKSLPMLSSKAASDDLTELLKEHERQTMNQLERLRTIGEELNIFLSGKTCAGMQGILKEGEEMLMNIEDEDVRDAAIIASAQKVEHYEIASYGTVLEYASRMGHINAEKLLSETLQEEKEADEILTQIAENRMNSLALDEE